MRLVTGNSILQADIDKVSVRIVSGGHSFSVEGLPRKAFDEGVTVEFQVITPKSLLVPAEAFDAASAAGLLAVAGIGCTPAEEPLCIVAGDKVAVAAVATQCLARIDENFGTRAAFTSPLLEECDADGCKLYIRTFGDCCCLRVCENGRLRFAEIMPAATPDEILYYVQTLCDRMECSEYLIYIYGEGASESAKLLRRYFKRVKCE